MFGLMQPYSTTKSMFHKFMCMCVCIYIYIYRYVYIYMYVHIYIYICICFGLSTGFLVVLRIDECAYLPYSRICLAVCSCFPNIFSYLSSRVSVFGIVVHSCSFEFLEVFQTRVVAVDPHVGRQVVAPSSSP